MNVTKKPQDNRTLQRHLRLTDREKKTTYLTNPLRI